MAMTAWSAKVSQQGDLAVGERPDLVPVDEDHAEQLVRSEHRDREDGPDGPLAVEP